MQLMFLLGSSIYYQEYEYLNDEVHKINVHEVTHIFLFLSFYRSAKKFQVGCQSLSVFQAFYRMRIYP